MLSCSFLSFLLLPDTFSILLETTTFAFFSGFAFLDPADFLAGRMDVLAADSFSGSTPLIASSEALGDTNVTITRKRHIKDLDRFSNLDTAATTTAAAAAGRGHGIISCNAH